MELRMASGPPLLRWASRKLCSSTAPTQMSTANTLSDSSIACSGQSCSQVRHCKHKPGAWMSVASAKPVLAAFLSASHVPLVRDGLPASLFRLVSAPVGQNVAHIPHPVQRVSSKTTWAHSPVLIMTLLGEPSLSSASSSTERCVGKKRGSAPFCMTARRACCVSAARSNAWSMASSPASWAASRTPSPAVRRNARRSGS